jgi:predicted SnoaL-like aldol condensation-catalyzing enzyme
MATQLEERNKALVLEAFDTLFKKRDYVAAERFWSSNYVQHGAPMGPAHATAKVGPNFLRNTNKLRPIQETDPRTCRFG